MESVVDQGNKLCEDNDYRNIAKDYEMTDYQYSWSDDCIKRCVSEKNITYHYLGVRFFPLSLYTSVVLIHCFTSVFAAHQSSGYMVQ